MEPSRRARVARLAFTVAGEAALAGALLSTARWYSPPGVIFFFVIGSSPLIGYLTSLKTFGLSLGTGLGLLALTLWTTISFALVPAESRDGVEFTWIFLDLLLGTLLAIAGLIVERRRSRRPLMS